MNETVNQANASDTALMLRQLEEVEGCGQDGHIVIECGALVGGCPWIAGETDNPSK